ncbi:MAG: lipid-binding SYLF domain-containing protein [Desulfarculales bacterium]|jgi:lipid-binding SYLF domain-containing protein|nr:lipid-binding SYLF domain-containing protein [Desulfarculales bacterium]
MKKISFYLLVLALCSVSPAGAAGKREADLTVDKARVVLESMMNRIDASVPSQMLRTAYAVVIIPSMLKGGLIIGASYGSGIISARQEDGAMGPPAFFVAGGGSVGLQIGGQSIDLILIIASPTGLGGVLKNQMTIGADASVAAGPLGRRGEISASGISAGSDLYSYSSSAGLFAGVSLDGTGLGYDRETTAAYYGREYTVHQVLLGGLIKDIPPSGQYLVESLNKYMAP